MQYRYNAVDSEGEAAAGTIEAGSAREATARLQERGFTVNRMERADGSGGLLRVSKRLGWDELSLFSEQLNAMVRSGLPLPFSILSCGQISTAPAGGSRSRLLKHCSP